MASVTNKENRALRSQSQQQQQGAFGADGSGAKLKPFQKTVETSPRDHSAANLQQLATPADSSPSMPANQAGSRTTRRSSRKGDPSAAAAVPPTSPDAANVSTVSPDSTSPPQSVPLPESPAAADNAIGICDARANNSGSGLLNASSPPAQDLTAWAETSFAQLSIDDCAVDESEHEVFFGIVSQKEIELASKVAARRRSLRGSKPETLPLAPPTTTLDATETPSSAEQVATPMVLCESQSSAPGICTAPQIASPAKVGDAEAKESLASAPRSPTRILNAADTLGVDIAATPSRSSVAHELGNASQQQQQQYKKFSNSQTPTKFSANRNPTSALSLLSSTPTKGRSTPSNKPMVQASTKGAFGISTPSRVVVTPMKSSAAAARVPLSPAPLARAGPSSPTVATRPQSSAAACRPAEPNIAPSLAVAPKAAAKFGGSLALSLLSFPEPSTTSLAAEPHPVRASMQTDAIASSCTQTCTPMQVDAEVQADTQSNEMGCPPPPYASLGDKISSEMNTTLNSTPSAAPSIALRRRPASAFGPTAALAPARPLSVMRPANGLHVDSSLSDLTEQELFRRTKYNTLRNSQVKVTLYRNGETMDPRLGVRPRPAPVATSEPRKQHIKWAEELTNDEPAAPSANKQRRRSSLKPLGSGKRCPFVDQVPEPVVIRPLASSNQ